MKIKLRKTDRLFTQLMRLIYKYTCQKCGRVYSPDDGLRNLGVSHYYGRSRENTRFDEDNCTLLCNLPCHRRWEGEEREDYKNYMIDRLGQRGFDILTVMANVYKKRDDALTEFILEEKIKDLDALNEVESDIELC